MAITIKRSPEEERAVRPMNDVLAVLLAGGAGERLYPLTRNTAKPAVPFGGVYRIIDFTLSNCINSNLRRIFVLTQYKSLELTRHVREGWNILSRDLDEFIELIPPMKRIHEDWYLGTADAVYQNIESIIVQDPAYVLVVSADHIYKMNYHEMIEWHQQNNAEITIATIQTQPEECARFGVAEITAEYRVVGFEEKPQHGNPKRSVFNPEMVSASMGIYVFNTQTLLEVLTHDAEDGASTHDFARDVIPRLLPQRRVIAYDFRDLNDKTVRYWRDVGTLDAYYEANLDLVAITPEFNLYDRRWPVHTKRVQQPPAKFVLSEERHGTGFATDSIVSPGVIVAGGRVNGSVLSPEVRVNSNSEVDSSILLPNCTIGSHSRIRRAIIGANVVVPESSVIGFDVEQDRAAGYQITENGVVVIA